MKKIYLAIPYSGYEEESFRLANEIAAELIKQGYIVFSPISMSHPISKIGGLKGNWETWMAIDYAFIEWSDEIIVVNFDEKAVKESTGVQDEIKYGKKLGKSIKNYYNK